MIFEQVGVHLQAQGFRLSTGTIVDAALIAAPSSTRNASGARAPEMKQSKKGNWAQDFTQHRGRAHKYLSAMQREINRRRSKVRARVGHVIGVIKCIFGFAKVRYRGRAKNGNRLFVAAALANLFTVRRLYSKAFGHSCAREAPGPAAGICDGSQRPIRARRTSPDEIRP